jgi:hypothetical protein
MKWTLGLSFLLNCALAACLALLFARGAIVVRSGNPPIRSNSQDAAGQVPAIDSPVPVVIGSALSESKPFRWSQLESPDYRIYVANLRGIGCPEQTLRDIVLADVHALYTPKRNELEARRAKSGLLERLNTDRLLQALQDQEVSLITTLLGANSVDEDTRAGLARQERLETPAVMPLVYQPVDPLSLGLGPEQVQAIENLRHRFLDEIGGLGQDPNAPAYLERWQQSQPSIDDDLRGMIGVNAYQDYQVRAQLGAPEIAPSAADPAVNK